MTTMIGLPLVSIVMFILAGILIGHLLWYHDRKIDLRRISKLEDRYQLVKGTALKRKQEFLHLQSEVSSHQHLLDQTRAEVNSTLAKQQQAEEETRAAKNRLLQFDRERGELAEQIDAETHRNESLVVQLKEALQLKTLAEQRLTEKNLSDESAEEVSATYRDRIEQLQQENLQLSENYEQEIEKLRIAISEQAAAAAQTTRDKEGAIIRLKDELESQQSSRKETTTTIQSVQQQVASLSDELKAVQADRDRLGITLTQKTEELAELQNANQTLIEDSEAKITEISQKLADANRELEMTSSQHQASLADLSKQEDSHAELTQKLQGLDLIKTEREGEKTQLAQQQATVQEQAKLIANQQDELSTQIDLAKKNELEIAKLREQEQELVGLRESVQQLETLKPERDTLSTQLRDVTSRHEQLTKDISAKESRIANLMKSLAEFEATKQQLAESKQQVSVVAADRQKLQQTHQRITSEAKSLREKLAENARVTEGLQKQLAEKDQRIDHVAAQTRETTKKLESQTAAAAKLGTELAAAERLRPANSELQQRLDDLTKRLQLISAEHEDSLESNAKAEDRIRDLQNQLHEYANKIRDQRRRLTSAGDISAAEALPKDDRRAA